MCEHLATSSSSPGLSLFCAVTFTDMFATPYTCTYSYKQLSSRIFHLFVSCLTCLTEKECTRRDQKKVKPLVSWCPHRGLIKLLKFDGSCLGFFLALVSNVLLRLCREELIQGFEHTQCNSELTGKERVRVDSARPSVSSACLQCNRPNADSNENQMIDESAHLQSSTQLQGHQQRVRKHEAKKQFCVRTRHVPP